MDPADPQYSTEIDAHIILVRLLGMLLQFRNAPHVDPAVVHHIEANYFGLPLVENTYKDALLLEELDYQTFEAEQMNPVHGHSNFHIGHQDPLAQPKHAPDNIYWRTFRSNLIQGNMTLREARIYIIKLIGRYFELGELNI